MSAVAASDFEKNDERHLKHLKLKGLPPKTIESYSRTIRRGGDYFAHPIDDLSEVDRGDDFTDLRETPSWSSVKLDLYGLQFPWEHVLKKPWGASGLIKPPRSQRWPDIVTVEESERIFLATQGLSDRVFFFTPYRLGLCLGEGLRRTVADLDGARERVHIRDAQGKQDRLVPLPTATHPLLRRFWPRHRHPVLRFPHRHGGLAGARAARTPLHAAGRMARTRCGARRRRLRFLDALRLGNGAPLQSERPAVAGDAGGDRGPAHALAPPRLPPACPSRRPSGGGRCGEAAGRRKRRGKNGPYLFNEKAMAQVFRARMLAAIEAAGIGLPA